MQLQTYVNYGGNCEEALRFYERNLGGKILSIMRFSEMPKDAGAPPNSMPANGVMHARIQIGGVELMASDAPVDRYQPMHSAYLVLNLDSNEEAERVYKLLGEGGEVFMPMAETFFAHRFAMLRDRFGTSWMLLRSRPMPAA